MAVVHVRQVMHRVEHLARDLDCPRFHLVHLVPLGNTALPLKDETPSLAAYSRFGIRRLWRRGSYAASSPRRQVNKKKRTSRTNSLTLSLNSGLLSMLSVANQSEAKLSTAFACGMYTLSATQQLSAVPSISMWSRQIEPKHASPVVASGVPISNRLLPD
jgi:hypothetical protein